MSKYRIILLYIIIERLHINQQQYIDKRFWKENPLKSTILYLGSLSIDNQPLSEDIYINMGFQYMYYRNLRSIELCNNLIDDTILSSICLTLKPLYENLDYLGLNQNLISDSGLLELIEELKNFNSFTSLNIASIFILFYLLYNSE